MEDEYKSFGSTLDCPSCGETLRSSCDQMGYRERFICIDCEKTFERQRDPIVNLPEADLITEETEEKDGFKEYYCPEHKTMHVISKPIGGVRELSTHNESYDQNHLECKCGEFHSVYKLSVDSCFECDCGRVFELSVSRID